MRNKIIRGALLCILLLGFAIPGAALAGGGGKGCSNIGTWFGVTDLMSPQTPEAPPWNKMVLTGWSVTVAGKSNNEGTNLFEYPIFDPKINEFFAQFEPFMSADRIGNMRGNWKRTGGNTFDYTFMGFAYSAEGAPVYIAKISGQVELILNCQYQHTAATMEVFRPLMNPFDDEVEPEWVIPLPENYGYRAKVVAPPPPPPVPF